MYLAKQGAKILGVDVFIVQKEMPVILDIIAGLKLDAISNRGTKIWPNQNIRFELCDVHRCRWVPSEPTLSTYVSQQAVVDLLAELTRRNLEFVHVEKLLEVNGKAAFSEIHAGGN